MKRETKKHEKNGDELRNVSVWTITAGVVHLVAAFVSVWAAFNAMSMESRLKGDTIYDNVDGPSCRRILNVWVPDTYLAVGIMVVIFAAYFFVMSILLFTIQCWNSNKELYHQVGIVFYMLAFIFFVLTIAWIILLILTFVTKFEKHGSDVPIFCVAYIILFAAVAVTYGFIGNKYREDSKENFIDFGEFSDVFIDSAKTT